MSGTSPARAGSRGVLIFGLLYPTVLTWGYFVALDGRSAAVQQLTYGAGKLFQFVFPAVWVWWQLRVRRDSLTDGPATPKRADDASGPIDRPFAWERPQWRGVLEGLAFGLAVAAAMLGLFFGFLQDSSLLGDMRHKVAAKVQGFELASPSRYLVLSAFYSLAHSGLEEYYWRWFVFRGLSPWLGRTAAVAWSSLGFMAHHVLLLASFLGWSSPFTWLGSLSVAVGGAVWAYQYQRSGQLYGPWLGHLCVDAAIFWIGGTMITV